MAPYLILIAQASAPGTVADTMVSGQEPTLEIRATLRADRVTVADSGTAEVTFNGSPQAVPLIETERNLPAGQQTYRQLEIYYRATTTLGPPAEEAGPIRDSVESDQTGD